MDLGRGRSARPKKKPGIAACVRSMRDGAARSSAGDQETFSAQDAEEGPVTCAGGAAFYRHARRRTSGGGTRPGEGELLGGMTEVPGPRIGVPRKPTRAALKQGAQAHRRDGAGIARLAWVYACLYAFFRWSLWSMSRSLPVHARTPKDMRWVPIATLDGEALPNVMRKVIAHGLWLGRPYS